jgi:hypothetical protein
MAVLWALDTVSREPTSYVCVKEGGIYCEKSHPGGGVCVSTPTRTRLLELLAQEPVPDRIPTTIHPEVDLPDGFHCGPATDDVVAVGGRMRSRLLHTGTVTMASRCILEDYIHTGHFPLDLARYLKNDRCVPPPLRMLLSLVITSDARSDRDTRAFRRNVSRLYRSASAWNESEGALKRDVILEVQNDGTGTPTAAAADA